MLFDLGQRQASQPSRCGTTTRSQQRTMPGRRLPSGLKSPQLCTESDQSAFAQNSIPIVSGGLQSGSLLDLKAVMDKTRIFRAFKVKPNILMRMVETSVLALGLRSYLLIQ